MASLKRGKASRTELEYIAANTHRPVKEVAEELKRSVAFVRKHTEATPERQSIEERSDWVSRLEASSFWGEVRKGLMGGEIEYFKQAWASYIAQYSSSDILATDELMIKDLCMLDILCQRALNDNANVTRRISELERLIQIEQDKDPDVRDQMELASWRNELTPLMAAKPTLSKEHREYQQRKDAKLRDLKGSREQRFKQIEERKGNFFELVKELDTEKKRRQEGRLNAKVQMAAELVTDDWNNVIEFEDGTLDKPLLSPEGELKDARLQNEQK